jgi:putative transposase
MPRTARASVGGYCYHVLNRGNRRAQVFHDADDYAAFLRLLRRASARVPMRLLAYCLMPNHFHLVLWPPGDADLSAWMGWLLTAHVRRHHRRYRSSGHIWQGRLKAFPISEHEHLLSVLRYVERNPLRANLVERAEDWPWSSLRSWAAPPLVRFLHPGPVPRGPDWLARVCPLFLRMVSLFVLCLFQSAPKPGSKVFEHRLVFLVGRSIYPRSNRPFTPP